MLLGFPFSNLIFLYIYTEDKIFKAKSPTGDSVEESSDTNWGFLEKQHTQYAFTEQILQCSGFQMFGCSRFLERQMHYLPGNNHD